MEAHDPIAVLTQMRQGTTVSEQADTHLQTCSVQIKCGIQIGHRLSQLQAMHHTTQEYLLLLNRLLYMGVQIHHAARALECELT